MIQKLHYGNLVWFNIAHPTDEDYDFLSGNFEFHPLDIEDCRTRQQRSKIDIYDDYYFLILHFPYFDKINRFIKIKEIKIFWGKNYIITVGNTHWIIRDLFEETQLKVEQGEEVDYLISSDKTLYVIIESLLKETLQVLTRVESEIDNINRYMFSKNAVKIIEKISYTRRNIILLNTTFKPQLRVIQLFELGKVKGFEPDMEEYWGNIADYYQRIMDMIEDDQELIEGLAKTIDSMLVNRTNEIVKILTMISTIMLPLTFITGVYGMNILLPFQEDTWAFYYVVGFMLFVAAFMLFVFKRKNWM
ncbi:MAG: magnesium transporter CorA family protein [Bacteroidales bacterium]|nr:magnesium transporter CorA family protein [Bacteroidales bacterium]